MGEVCLKKETELRANYNQHWSNFSRFSHSADFLREERERELDTHTTAKE